MESVTVQKLFASPDAATWGSDCQAAADCQSAPPAVRVLPESGVGNAAQDVTSCPTSRASRGGPVCSRGARRLTGGNLLRVIAVRHHKIKLDRLPGRCEPLRSRTPQLDRIRESRRHHAHPVSSRRKHYALYNHLARISD